MPLVAAPPPPPFVTLDRPVGLSAAGDRTGALVVVTRASFPARQPHLWLRPAAGAPLTDTGVAPGATKGSAAASTAMAPDGGEAVVAWREDRPKAYTAIRVIVRPSGDAAFGAPQEIAGPAFDGVRAPAIALGGRGAGVLAFLRGVRLAGADRAKRDRVVLSVHRPGGVLGTLKTVTRTSSGAPVAASGPDGRSVVAWVRRERVEAVAIDERGHIGAVQVLGPAPSLLTRPAVAAGNGGAVVAWSAPTGGRRNVVRAATLRADATFRATRELRSSRPLSLLDVAAQAGPGGRMLVAWTEGGFDAARRRPANIGLNGAVSTLRGRVLGGSGAPVGGIRTLSDVNAAWITEPALEADATGFRLVAAYRRTAAESGALAERVSADGVVSVARLWQTGASSAPINPIGPVLAAGGDLLFAVNTPTSGAAYAVSDPARP